MPNTPENPADTTNPQIEQDTNVTPQGADMPDATAHTPDLPTVASQSPIESDLQSLTDSEKKRRCPAVHGCIGQFGRTDRSHI